MIVALRLYVALRFVVGWSIYLLLGALVYQRLFGDPLAALGQVTTWGVIVFWPWVLVWWALWWVLIVAAVVFCGAAIIVAAQTGLTRRRARARMAARLASTAERVALRQGRTA